MTSPALLEKPRSLFTALCEAGAIEFDWHDWCDTRNACKDFISNCRWGDDSYKASDVRHHFFKLLRDELMWNRTYSDSLDRVDYEHGEELSEEMRRVREYDEYHGTSERWNSPLIEERQ